MLKLVISRFGLIFERLHGSSFRGLLLLVSTLFMRAIPANILSYKLFAFLADDLSPTSANAIFLKLTRPNNWADYEKFESLLRACLSIDLSSDTLNLFSRSIIPESLNADLANVLISFQKTDNAPIIKGAGNTVFLENLKIPAEAKARLLVATGLKGSWQSADLGLSSLIENLDSSSSEKLAKVLRGFPSAAVFVAFEKRGESQLFGPGPEDLAYMLSKKEIRKKSSTQAVDSFFRWRNYKSANEAGVNQFERLGQIEKVKVWKSGLLSQQGNAANITGEMFELAKSSSQTSFLDTLLNSDSNSILKEALATNQTFLRLIDNSHRSIRDLGFSRVDLRRLAYADAETAAGLVSDCLESEDFESLTSSQTGLLIQSAARLDIDKEKLINASRRAIHQKAPSLNLVVNASKYMDFAELVSLLSSRHSVRFEQFFIHPVLAGVQTLDSSDRDFQAYKSKFLKFWTSREEFGLSRFEIANVATRESLLSKLLNSDPLTMANLVASTRHTDLHLNHRMAMAISHFALSDFESADEIARDVSMENPSWNLARSIVNMSAQRVSGDLKTTYEFQKSLNSSPYHLDSPTAAAAFSAGFYDRSKTLIEKSFSDLKKPNVYGHASNPNINWASDKILLFEIWGVSDEIRAAQDLKKLDMVAENLSVICDPRLESWFEISFPNINFIPFARRHKDPLSPKPEVRGTQGFLDRFIPELTMREISKFDAVIVSSSLTNSRLLRQKYPEEGPFLVSDKSRFRPDLISDRKRIGVVWRSGVSSGLREFIYMSVEEILEPLLGLSPDFEIHSLQHNTTVEETEYLERNGVVQNVEIDFFNDLRAVGDYCANLDLVIGLSTSGTEIAASVGTPVWMLGISPENYFLRTAGGRTTRDVLTANSEVIKPVGSFNRKKEEVIEDVMSEVVLRLSSKHGGQCPRYLSDFDDDAIPPPLIEL